MVDSLKEDVHFYIDNAPPEEVAFALRVLSADLPLTGKQVSQALTSQYGFTMQKDVTYSPRRLYDLGLAKQVKNSAKQLAYVLTDSGLMVQQLMASQPELAFDLLHYLHYSGYTTGASGRKYLWSYRVCCDLLWSTRKNLSNTTIASRVQSVMKERFPDLDFTAPEGVRFDGTGAGRAKTWIRVLTPSPLGSDADELVPRQTKAWQLPVLALDLVYRERQYPYKSPMLLDDGLSEELARVFFLEPSSCLH